ncbi:MAG TPA: hypothetical protein VIM87_00470 [Chitinophaga sp.]|uniref:hypothetical protein n=1 Tax=Chitinophaga sp. TaxID=1869181 RepID=UPI002F93BA8F
MLQYRTGSSIVHCSYSGIPFDIQQLMESRIPAPNAPRGGISAWALVTRSRNVASLPLTKFLNFSSVEKSAPAGAVAPL